MQKPDERWLEAIVSQAMDEVQRNAVPVIRRLLLDAQNNPPNTKICSLDEGCGPANNPHE